MKELIKGLIIWFAIGLLFALALAIGLWNK